MKIVSLISTMRKNNIGELELEKKNIEECVIVNQTTESIPFAREKDASMHSYNEIGLAKSRNRLLENINDDTDIAIITDDDVSFEKGYAEKIEEAYTKFKDADVIIFKSVDENRRA